MERYSNEIRLIVTAKLKTTKDVKIYITQTEKDIKNITNLRQKYRNRLRNCKNDDLIKEYKEKQIKNGQEDITKTNKKDRYAR